jgi:hypothetical protein
LAIRVRELEDSSEEGAALSAERLDEVVTQINCICRSSGLEFALLVGSVIIHSVYAGDTEAWRSRGPKANSFRRLAEHPDVALSAGTLCRCVAIFEICDRLGAASRWPRLGASHLRAVIGIPRDKQEYLLRKANDERWSSQTLRTQALRLSTGPSRGGRRAQSELGKHLRRVDRWLQGYEQALDGVASHELNEIERSLQLLRKVKASVEELAGVVEWRWLQVLERDAESRPLHSPSQAEHHRS